MCYIITDGTQYISTKNGIHSVQNIKQATDMTLLKASNILKTIPKTLSQIADWSILPLPEKSENTSNNDSNFRYDVEYMDLDTVIDSIKQLSTQAEKLTKYNKSINSHLAEVNLEIEDMYHYIEFNTLNAAQGYKAYKMLKERLIKRRYLKDEQILLESIQEKNMLTYTQEHLENEINKLESRNYRPRVLNELFSA
jgi:hypothetical protein